MTSHVRKRGAVFIMLAAAVLWSTGGIFIKVIPWSPFLTAGVRGLISGCVMAAYMKWQKVDFKWNRYSFGAGIGLSVSATMFTVATKLTTAANAIVLQYTAPVFILILSAILVHQKMRKKEIAVVAITMMGMVLFFFDQLSLGNVMGNLLGILAGAFLSIMFIMIGRGGDDDSTRLSGLLIAHFMTMVIGTPVGIAFTSGAVSGFEGLTGTVNNLGTEVLFILILGVFQMGISYVLYGIASRDCSPLACSLIAMLEPILNPTWVAIFIGEKPGGFALIGGVIIIAIVTWWCVSESRNL